MIKELELLPYEEKLLLFSLERRQTREAMTEMYKIMHSMDTVGKVKLLNPFLKILGPEVAQ